MLLAHETLLSHGDTVTIRSEANGVSATYRLSESGAATIVSHERLGEINRNTVSRWNELARDALCANRKEAA